MRTLPVSIDEINVADWDAVEEWSEIDLAAVRVVRDPRDPRPRPTEDDLVRIDGYAVRDPEDPSCIRYWE